MMRITDESASMQSPSPHKRLEGARFPTHRDSEAKGLATQEQPLGQRKMGGHAVPLGQHGRSPIHWTSARANQSPGRERRPNAVASPAREPYLEKLIRPALVTVDTTSRHSFGAHRTLTAESAERSQEYSYDIGDLMGGTIEAAVSREEAQGDGRGEGRMEPGNRALAQAIEVGGNQDGEGR